MKSQELQNTLTRIIEFLSSELESLRKANCEASVIEELHSFVIGYWNRNGKEGVPNSLLHKFLIPRVTQDKIHKVITTAERRALIVKVPGTDNWLPRPRDLTQFR